MPLLITERDVRTVVSEPGATSDAIAAMGRLFIEQARGGLNQVPRVHVTHREPGDPDATHAPGRSLRLMPAIVPALGVACARVYTTKQADDTIATPSEHLLLYELDGMTLRAIIEDRSLHTLRTAAPTGLATDHLARADATRVGVIGTGRHARGQLAAVAAVRPLEEVAVFGRDQARREQFCRDMALATGVRVRPVAAAEDAVDGADIVVTATTTTTPVLRGRWLSPGVHVNSIAPCELDEDAVAQSRVFPAYTRQLTEGTPTWTPIPQMVRAGRLDADALATTELCQVVAGRTAGRTDPDAITLFISSGMAGWDAAIASWIDERARQAGLGTELTEPEVLNGTTSRDRGVRL